MANQIRHFIKKIDAGLWLSALLTLLIIQTLLQPGLPTLADMSIHLYRILEYGHAWSSGVIVPRWAPNLAFGYGYPLFIFAPPLPYLFGLGLHTVGFTIETALKLLIILTILLYATGMYLLGRDTLRSVPAGVVAATAYAFAPFALREALLYGGNIPQFLAIALFPWIFWALTRLSHTRNWKWLTLSALFYAAIMVSHLFHVLIITPFVGLYSLILAGFTYTDIKSTNSLKNRTFRFSDLRTVILPLLTIPLGLLLSAFFWIPAFIERGYTRSETDVYLEKSPFFIRYPHWSELVAMIQPLDGRAANPYVPLSLSLVTVILATLGLICVIILFTPIKSKIINLQSNQVTPSSISYLQTPITILFFALIATLAIFMSLPISRPMWETISILQVGEFPWRMLGLANLGLALLAGAALLFVPHNVRWIVTAGVLVLQILAVTPYLYPVTAFTQYGQSSLADQIDYERRSQSIGTTTLGEYLPQPVAEAPTNSPLVPALMENQFPERFDRATLPAAATATLLQQTAVNHAYQVDSPVDFTARFLQFDYPGWVATLDGQPLPITPEPKTGLIQVDIPAGQHRVVVQFRETWERTVPLLMTGATVVGLLLVGVLQRRNKRGQSIFLPIRESFSWPMLGGSTLLLIIVAFGIKPQLQPFFTTHSPPDKVLPADYVFQADFAEGIQLVGYDLSRSIAAPGDYVRVVLYWQTSGAPHRRNLQPFVHLDRLESWTTVVDDTNYTPGDVTTESNLPTFHWDNERYIRDEHDLYLPADMAPTAYALRVGLIDPDQGNQLHPLADGNGDTVQLTTINITPVKAPPRLSIPLNPTFANETDTVYLTGFQIDSLTPEMLNFSLAWRSDQTPLQDYVVFAQLLDVGQNLAASFDRPPLDGTYPTTTWLPGQTILDPRIIPVEGVSAGEYTLIVGMYDPVTQQRLPTTNGQDFIELTNLVIE
ncbi:MAG: 6-pyruvoyl-tetrahydropterin synthase-related protein [Chloroflexota bacterium]